MSSGMASSRALHSPPGLEPVVPVKPVTSYNPIRHSERVGDSSTPHSLERSTDSDGQSKSPGSSLSPYPQDYPVPTQYLEDITNQVLPILFFSLFLIIGAVVLVYSLAEHQALPPHLATGLAITICVVLLLWVSLRIILYCAGRKRLGSFWSSPRQRCPLFVAERGDAHSMALEMKHGGGTKSKELFRPWCAYGSYFQPEQQARQGLSRPMMGQDKSLPLRKIRKEDWESISSENGGKGGAGRFYAKLRFPKDYNRSSTDWGNLPNILHQSKAIPIVSRDPGPARGDLSKGRYRLGNLTTSNKDHKTTHIIPSRKQVMVESDLPPPGRGLKARNSVDESLSTIPRQQGHLRVTNQGPIVPSPEPSPVLSTQVYSLSQPTPVHTRPCPSIGTFRQIKIPAPLLNMMDVQPSLFGRPGHLTHTKPPRADTPMPSPQFAPTETPRLLPQSNHSYLDTLVDFTGTKQSFIPTSDTMVDGTPEGAPPIHYLQIHSAPPEINKQLSSTKVFYEAFRRTSTSRASEVENRVFSAYSPPDTNLLLHAQKFIQKEAAQYLPDTSQRESLDISERDTAFSDPDYEDLSAKEDNRISRMPGMKDPSPGYKRYANRPSAMEAVSPMEDEDGRRRSFGLMRPRLNPSGSTSSLSTCCHSSSRPKSSTTSQQSGFEQDFDFEAVNIRGFVHTRCQSVDSPAPRDSGSEPRGSAVESEKFLFEKWQSDIDGRMGRTERIAKMGARSRVTSGADWDGAAASFFAGRELHAASASSAVEFKDTPRIVDTATKMRKVRDSEIGSDLDFDSINLYHRVGPFLERDGTDQGWTDREIRNGESEMRWM